ncbi:hypothetical protein AWN90_03335 [Nocardia terpenica]|uniref:Uncharacterized protein n=1 Tax=Nocardia terpenica TaxID=455432 RepID=A0A164KVC3_9NOCA|nr:hypothetical protein AWN90_03335 [Nocardia terpenica]
MPSSLVLILWPASVFFIAMLSFRGGMWWKGIYQHGRHEFTPGQCHGDESEAYQDDLDDDAAWMMRQPASAPEGWMDTEATTDELPYADQDHEQNIGDAVAGMDSPPAEARAVRWWSDDEDTAVLPRIQDIVPPTRATPIRRPPWVSRGSP